MEVGEAATSGIDTGVEAARMANSILDDLKEPRSYVTLVTPMFYPAQLGDTIEIDKDGVTFDQAIKIVVYSVKHTIDGSTHRTEWVGRQTGGGYRDRWMESEVRPGVGPRQDLTLDSNSLKATLGSNQSITNAGIQTIVFDTACYDFGGNYNIATGVYTVPATGIYEFSAGAVAFPTLPNTTWRIYLFKNGVLHASGDVVSQSVANTNTFLYVKLTTLVAVLAGDAFTIRIQHSSGISHNVLGNADTYFTVRRLRGG
jgi:hypothetical protein